MMKWKGFGSSCGLIFRYYSIHLEGLRKAMKTSLRIASILAKI
jgi:hypothetical protein